MRVKLTDPQQHVRQFEYGKFYDISFYGTNSFLRFQHTRKNHTFLMRMERDVDGEWTIVSARTKISKRRLKRLLHNEDAVQWVVESDA